MNIETKEQILSNSLINFYYNNDDINKIIPIITGKSNISLRILDWFITTYSYKYNIINEINNNNIYFNIYNEYKGQLKAYNKRYFDPFCRKNNKNNIKEIIFKYNDNNNYIQSTIGQLNFFRWILKNNILAYIINNYTTIYNDMANSNCSNKKTFGKVNNKLGTKILDLETNNNIKQEFKMYKLKKKYLLQKKSGVFKLNLNLN